MTPIAPSGFLKRSACLSRSDRATGKACLMLLSRSQFLGLNKRRFKTVSIPDGLELPDASLTCGMSVRIRSLTEGESATFEMSNLRFAKNGEKVLVSQVGMEEHRRRLLRLVLVDEGGSSLLGPEDDLSLIGLDNMVTSIIYAEACKHTGIKERDEEPEKKDSKRINDAGGTGN